MVGVEGQRAVGGVVDDAKPAVPAALSVNVAAPEASRLAPGADGKTAVRVAVVGTVADIADRAAVQRQGVVGETQLAEPAVGPVAVGVRPGRDHDLAAVGHGDGQGRIFQVRVQAAAHERKRAAADGDRPAVGALAGQCDVVAADRGDRTAAADDAAVGLRHGAVEDQGGVVGDVAGHRAAGEAVAEHERAGRDRGPAAVGLDIGQGQRVAAQRGQGTVAADRAGEGLVGPVIEDQKAVVGHRARAGKRGVLARLPVAELERAGRDRRAAGVAAGIGERQ